MVRSKFEWSDLTFGRSELTRSDLTMVWSNLITESNDGKSERKTTENAGNHDGHTRSE